MIEYELPLDENMDESFPGMTFEFPYLWIWGEMDKYIGGHVPWHWHEEVEFCYLLKGEVEYHFSNKIVKLEEGDAMFVNSNVLHLIKSCEDCKGAIIIPQIINKLLLIGYHRSVYDNKYYKPIVNCDNLPYYHLHGDDDTDSQMLRLLIDAYKLAEKEEFGYEVKVRNNISELWVRLYGQVREMLSKSGHIQNKTDKRLKQMIAFVNKHYMEKITLEDIAQVGNISVRECIRNFKKNMQITPFQYLQQLRVEFAANMLMNSDLSITEIALKNGFATSSHFTQLFKEYMHCTPKQYRNTGRQNYKQSSFTEKK